VEARRATTGDIQQGLLMGKLKQSKHAQRAAIVWWLGCLALAMFLVVTMDGYRVDRTLGLPQLHLASAIVAGWLVLLSFAWFGFFSLFAHGAGAARTDLFVVGLVWAVVLVCVVLGFLAWEDADRVLLHGGAAWGSLTAQIGGLVWFRHRRLTWFTTGSQGRD
jgi:hypothetical protein